VDDKGFDSINIIPFIDIMLVLLTIVLTTATFITSGSIPIELPHAEAPAIKVKGLLKVEIDRKGQLFFDGEAVDLTSLRLALHACDRQRPVVVRADRSVALQSFVGVMDLLRDLHFGTVSLLTEVRQ
jgi:biopolymer transport protein ExbD